MLKKQILGTADALTGAASHVVKNLTDQTFGAANLAVSCIPSVDTINIPKDLSEVTQVGDEVAPGELNLADNSVENIWKSVEGFYRSRLHNNISLCVRREGKIILNRSIGIAQGEYGDDNAVPGSVDTPYCIFSASKAVSAMLLCKFEELGELSLRDPITKYIPKFGKHGKQSITLGELISHRGKIPSFRIEDPAQLSDHDCILDHLCNAKPHDAKQAYHAITGGFIIAEVIEKLTGEPIQKSLDTYFRAPMEMKHFTYGLEKKYRKTYAQSHMSGIPVVGPIAKIPENIVGMCIQDVVDMSNANYFMDCSLPAGNIFTTGEELSRFYQMLLDDGVYQNKQIFHPDTIQKAVSGNFFPSWDSTFNIPTHFSRGGFMLNSFPTWLFGINAPKAFGHLGFLNVLSWADPQRKISVGLMTSGKPFLGPHLYNFATIPNSINSNCPKL